MAHFPNLAAVNQQVDELVVFLVLVLGEDGVLGVDSDVLVHPI